MEVDVDERGCEIFNRCEALIEVPRAHQAAEKIVGDRFAGFAMGCVAAQDLGLRQPMLVELGREFDEIRRDACAREKGIGDVGQKPVQGVAELVEQGAGVIEAQERRLALSRNSSR